MMASQWSNISAIIAIIYSFKKLTLQNSVPKKCGRHSRKIPNNLPHCFSWRFFAVSFLDPAGGNIHTISAQRFPCRTMSYFAPPSTVDSAHICFSSHHLTPVLTFTYAPVFIFKKVSQWVIGCPYTNDPKNFQPNS